jgi:hypothetical protein
MKFLSLATLLMLGACAHDMALMTRDETLHAYGAAIRWGSFDAATRFQSPRAHHRPLPDSLREVKVSGYHVITQAIDKDHLTLTQNVEIHYYRDGDLVEHTTMDEQLWHYDEETREWRIDTPLPRFP